MTVSIVMVGDTELYEQLSEMSPTVQRLVMAKVQSLAIELQRHIVQDKLSGQVLKVVTGNLRRSIQYIITQDGGTITGKVFSSNDVKYAAIHEFGGTIVPVKANALSWIGPEGKRIFAKSVTLKERSFMRSSLADQKQSIIAGLTAAVAQGVKGSGSV
jgi:phage gpG-like protein